MKELDLIRKLLLAIYGAKLKGAFTPELVSEKALRATEIERDSIAADLQREGYITGLHVVDGLDGQCHPYVAWNVSEPYVTIKGLEYMDENSAITRIATAMKEMGRDLTTQAILTFMATMMNR